MNETAGTQGSKAFYIHRFTLPAPDAGAPRISSAMLVRRVRHGTASRTKTWPSCRSGHCSRLSTAQFATLAAARPISGHEAPLDNSTAVSASRPECPPAVSHRGASDDPQRSPTAKLHDIAGHSGASPDVPKRRIIFLGRRRDRHPERSAVLPFS
jgi:hypothetical protein